MNKKLHSLLLACLCIQPIQTKAEFDYIPDLRDPNTIGWLTAGIVGLYAAIQGISYCARQLGSQYAKKCGISSASEIADNNWNNVGCNTGMGATQFQCLADLQRKRYLFTGIYGYIMFKYLTRTVENAFYTHSKIFKGIEHKATESMICFLNDEKAIGRIQNYAHYVSYSSGYVAPTCQTSFFLGQISFLNQHEAKSIVESMATNSIYMKEPLYNCLSFMRKDPIYKSQFVDPTKK